MRALTALLVIGDGGKRGYFPFYAALGIGIQRGLKVFVGD